MSLIFRNEYSFTPGRSIYVAYMWYNPDSCGGDRFNTTGWYEIPPGGEATVWNGNVKDVNRYWYYYAESADGVTWAGPIQGWVSNQAFRLCHGNSCTPCRVVGFRLLDVNSFDNYRLTLTT